MFYKMNNNKELKYVINYYFREKYYQTAESLALEGLKTFPDDYSFKLYNCFSLVLIGRFQESIRELELLINLKDINICATIALITAHKNCQVVDKEAVLQLENKLKTDKNVATDLGLYYGALFLFFTNKLSKSVEYLEKFLKSNPDSVEGLVLKGWLELYTCRNSNFLLASQFFSSALDKEKKNLDAFLGLVKVKEKENDLNSATALLNQLIVKYPSCLLPLIEKMKIQLSSNDWDLAIESANRIFLIDSSCIEALKIKAIVLICKNGNFEEASYCLKQLYNEIGKFEKKNSRLYFDIAQLFSYVSGKHQKILTETYNFAEKAAQLEPSNSEFLTELGYQNLLQKNFKEAIKFFKNATKLDESSISALTGLTMCQIEEEGINEQFKQQVEFLREIQYEQPNSTLMLLSSRLTNNVAEAIGFLNQCVKIHFDNFKKYSFGILYLYHMNPVFLMQVVYEYLKYEHANISESLLGEKVSEVLAKCLMILEEITNSCPGLIEAQYNYAHVLFKLGNLKKARQILSFVLEKLDPTSADAHILMAQIHFQEKNYQLGAQSLESGVSHNFKIREHPIYFMITAMAKKHNGNLMDCINLLKSAVSMTVVNEIKDNERLSKFSLSTKNKVALYLELIDAYQQINDLDAASQLIENAYEEFKGTNEKSRFNIANAQMLIQQNKISQGLELLQKIQPNDNYYFLAKTVLANVYLNYKKDREKFAQCYKDLVENQPNAETFTMLGDALMSIQEANKAIEAYEEALKTDPKNIDLVCKLGKALMKTHYFSKTINYYKEAVKNDRNLELIYDLAELYFKLGQLDNAEKVLITELGNEKNSLSESSQLLSRTKLLQLLAKVRDKSGNLTESLSALKEAKDNFNHIDKRLLLQSEEHQNILSIICFDMAVLLTRLRDFNGAIKCYKDSLAAKPDDTKVLVAVCRLYLQINNLEECESTSKKLLAADPNSELATIMLADLAFRKIDFESAALHFKQLLNKKPTYWMALARLIEVMRRTGNLDNAVPFLEKAENSLLQPTQDAGYSYCKGLYERYAERPGNALHHFNRAKQHSEWGQKALCNMIEICLNPDNETLPSEALVEDMTTEEIQDSRQMALRTAQRLLSELKGRQDNSEILTCKLLENFYLLATNQKLNIERALQDFTILASQDSYKDHVGIAFGIASSYVLQKQIQKAKNQLKRIIKSSWSYEDAEYLEKSWLLLTDIYIQAGKMEVPVELIQKILQHNKSCYKAYDYAGLIAEKEQLYKDAAVQYENAWRFCGQTNPAIGYKLAFNYLKCKKYADAIEVCYAILKQYPDYPRIQKEILEKAKTNLRT